jgi:hypothetical protein
LHAWRVELRDLAELKRQRQQLLLTMRWSLCLPNNPDRELLSPYPATLETIRTLNAHDALRPRLVGEALCRAIGAPPRIGNAAAGALTTVTRRGDDIIVKGDAEIPRENRAADCVVIGYADAAGIWNPLTVCRGGLPFAHAFRANRALQGAVFGAWAVDLREGKAFPLTGAISVP